MPVVEAEAAPIDWSAVHTAKDYGTWDRDGHAAELIKREVLAKGRKALVVYGDLHFLRKNPRARDPADDAAYSTVTLLEKDAAIRPFTVRTIAHGMDPDKLQPDIVAWPRPSLALLPGHCWVLRASRQLLGLQPGIERLKQACAAAAR